MVFYFTTFHDCIIHVFLNFMSISLPSTQDTLGSWAFWFPSFCHVVILTKHCHMTYVIPITAPASHSTATTASGPSTSPGSVIFGGMVEVRFWTSQNFIIPNVGLAFRFSREWKNVKCNHLTRWSLIFCDSDTFFLYVVGAATMQQQFFKAIPAILYDSLNIQHHG